jgi:hypothetical protein
MDLGDATSYLRHHLALAGRSDQLFALCRYRHKANYPDHWIMPTLRVARAGRVSGQSA